MSNSKESGQKKNKYENPVSYHSLLFPFKFKKPKYKKSKLVRYDEISLKTIAKTLGSKWEYTPFKIGEDLKKYNEYVYFYDYVRDIIFNEHEEIKEDAIVADFTYKGINYSADDPPTYKLTVKGKYEPYMLQIRNITLKVYKMGVAILCYELENYDHNSKADVLKINDYIRRLYPQFLPFDTVRGAFLPEKVELNLKNSSSIIKDVFHKSEEIFHKSEDDAKNTNDLNKDYLKGITKSKRIRIPLPAFIQEILGCSFSTTEKACKIFIEPIIDDRMFLTSFYFNDEWSHQLTDFNENKNEYPWERSEDWYQYIFADGNGCTCQSRIMLYDELKKHTYHRWANYGTLYGLTRYSFCVLGDEGDFNRNVIYNHIKTMYKEIIMLVLAQRAIILRFFDEVSRISSIPSNQKKRKEITEKVSALHQKYLEFMNKMYKSKVTAQEQGIEIYNHLQEDMDIALNLESLSKEIESLHNYANLLEDKQMSKTQHRIGIFGAMFLIPTLISSFFGINLLDGKSRIGSIIECIKDNDAIMIILSILLLVAPLLAMLIGGIYSTFKDKKK